MKLLVLALLGAAPLAYAETVNLLPEAVSGLSIAGDAGAPTASVVEPVGDTIYMRARDFASGAVRGNLNYLRFDLSDLAGQNIQSATLTLHRVAGDTVVPGRVAIFGMLDEAGNAPQDWDPSSFAAGDEFDISMFEDDVASSGVSPVDLEQVADFSEQDAVSGTVVTLSSDELTAFLQARADASEPLATLLLTIPSQGAGTDRSLTYASHTYPDDPALRPTLTIVYGDADLPDPPTGLAVTDITYAADPSVELSWDAVAEAESYRLFRRASGETEAVEIGTADDNQFTDDSVSLFQTYYYAVAVLTADSESIPSTEVDVTVRDASAGLPVVPANLSLSSGASDSIELDWDASDGAFQYTIFRSTQPDRGYVLVDTVASPGYTDDLQVEPYQTYYYRVQATGAGGISTVSQPFRVEPRFDDSVTPPAAPTNPAVADSDTYSIELSWDAAAEAEAYYVYRATFAHGDYQLLEVVENNAITDTYALYPQNAYHYRIVAVNAGGFSEEAAEFEVAESLVAHRQIEALSRALVAVETDGGVYLGWRLLGTDPSDVAFNLYRDGMLLNDEPLTASTNFLDAEGDADASYWVAPVIDGLELTATAPASVLTEQYLSVPLQIPAGGTTPDNASYTYSANDASVADLDGDGELEIVLKWDPSNAQDNSNAGYTGNVILDAYEMDGTHLWRIDLGHNIRAGAHYTQFMVYDFDGDGKAEMIVKTADGTTDAAGTVVGDASADYREDSGFILSGPEFLTAFDGETGTIIDTVDYIPARGDLTVWGDDYGNRADRLMAAVAYFDGVRPSYIATRGIYRGQGGTPGRTVIAAFDLVDGELVSRWVFDTLEEGDEYAGQGHHQLAVGDADGDGRDEILYGALTLDDDGSVLYNTELGHGDAMHFGDFDPTHPGLEVFAVKEATDNPLHILLREAATGDLIWGVNNARDTGRGLTADIDPNHPGTEGWGAANLSVWNSDGEVIGTVRPSINFATWWDGDVLRELTDGTSIRKWDYINNTEIVLLDAAGTASNNGTKATPALQADLLGDWREEVMWRTAASDALRIYTTTDLSDRRIPTLMHDPVYRLAVAWQNVSYNQPPHPSFFIGQNMPQPGMPQVFVPPMPELVGTLTDGAYTSAVQLVLGVNQGLANEYRLNDGEWMDYDGPVLIEESGDYTVDFRTSDAEDTELASASLDFTVDNQNAVDNALLYFGLEEDELGDYWLDVDGLGWIYVEDFPWIYDFDHGWLYLTGATFAQGGWIWEHSARRWWYSNAADYPWIYVQGSGWIELGASGE